MKNGRLAILALVAASGVAQADGLYSLSGVRMYNPFAPSGNPISSGVIPIAGSCTVSGGSVGCSGIQYSFVNSGATWNYTNGTWSTSLGASSITHTETCVESAGTPCTGAVSGLSGLWTSGVRNGGAPSNSCTASVYFVAGVCDRVSVAENEGVSLTIIEQSEFAFAGAPSGFIYDFVAVPLPGAAWLFSGGLAALAYGRRRGVRSR